MAAEVAKAILAGGSFVPGPAREGGLALLDLARRDPHATDAWYAALDSADVDSIIYAIGGFGSVVTSNPATLSLREAARSIVERKLNAEMIAKMRDLEAVTTQLERRAYFVGVIGVLATIIGTIATVASLVRGCAT